MRFAFHKNEANLAEFVRLYNQNSQIRNTVAEDELEDLAVSADRTKLKGLGVGQRHVDVDGYVWERVA